MAKLKPFVKWAGGKRQLLNELLKYIPDNYNCYFEPFLGGGALFFELSPEKAIVNDYNSELINVYKCIKDNDKFNKLIKELDRHEANHSKEYFYEIRNLDRNKESFNKLADYKRAARTIYLNKACFNGLYRVNSKNEFNVPFGQKEKVKTYDQENLGNINKYVNNNIVRLLNLDFEDAVKDAKKGDLIYFDPPYDSDTETFNRYTDNGFSKDEQKRLADVYKKLSDKGCYVILSNHNTKLINELYKDFNIHVVKAKRVINSNAKKRGFVEEVIITNF